MKLVKEPRHVIFLKFSVVGMQRVQRDMKVSESNTTEQAIVVSVKQEVILFLHHFP